jgi:CheY-like chemotaxis protein
MMRVLIIDDEPGIRLALRRWFERQGYAVDDAANGEDAWTHLERLASEEHLTPSVIICDVNLPGISGCDLLARLRARQSTLVHRFILTTGDDVHDQGPDGLLAQHAFVLPKPFDLTALRVMMDRVFDAR